MRKLVIIMLIGIFVYALTPLHTEAHVFITDKNNTHGAILHITPDDDPIAGETSTLYFDTQGLENSEVSLKVRDTVTGKIDQLAAVTADSPLATMQYAFPTQGIYELVFSVSGDDTQTFTKHQRVSRGVSTDNSVAENHLWAEMLLILSGIGLVVLFAVFLDRRKEIAAKSR